jgi:hypothetical protein
MTCASAVAAAIIRSPSWRAVENGEDPAVISFQRNQPAGLENDCVHTAVCRLVARARAGSIFLATRVLLARAVRPSSAALRPRWRGTPQLRTSSARLNVVSALTAQLVLYFGTRAAFPSLFHPWNADKSPASQASRSPGALRSQSRRISRVTSRRSCHKSTTEGRPQNQ